MWRCYPTLGVRIDHSYMCACSDNQSILLHARACVLTMAITYYCACLSTNHHM